MAEAGRWRSRARAWELIFQPAPGVALEAALWLQAEERVVLLVVIWRWQLGRGGRRQRVLPCGMARPVLRRVMELGGLALLTPARVPVKEL
jgi:hypothetical protein